MKKSSDFEEIQTRKREANRAIYLNVSMWFGINVWNLHVVRFVKTHSLVLLLEPNPSAITQTFILFLGSFILEVILGGKIMDFTPSVNV